MREKKKKNERSDTRRKSDAKIKRELYKEKERERDERMKCTNKERDIINERRKNVQMETDKESRKTKRERKKYKDREIQRRE